MDEITVVKNIVDNLLTLGSLFNARSLNLFKTLGLNVEGELYGFIGNLLILFLLYKIVDGAVKGILLNIVRGTISLIFLLTALSMLHSFI